MGVEETAKLGFEHRLHGRHGAIVHGDGDPLVLDEHAGNGTCQPVNRPDQGLRHRRAGDFDRAVRLQAQLGAVHAGGSDPRRSEQPVDLVDLPSGENGKGAAERSLQLAKRGAQARGRRHVRRYGRNVEKRPVEIEKQGDASRILDLQSHHSKLPFCPRVTGEKTGRLPN